MTAIPIHYILSLVIWCWRLLLCRLTDICHFDHNRRLFWILAFTLDPLCQTNIRGVLLEINSQLQVFRNTQMVNVLLSTITIILTFCLCYVFYNSLNSSQVWMFLDIKFILRYIVIVHPKACNNYLLSKSTSLFHCTHSCVRMGSVYHRF